MKYARHRRTGTAWCHLQEICKVVRLIVEMEGVVAARGGGGGGGNGEFLTNRFFFKQYS